MSRKIFDAKCKECAHCDIENLLCRPNSKDCKELYELTKEDLEKMGRCDFFSRKKEESGEQNMNEDHSNITWNDKDEIYADYGNRAKKSSIIKTVAGYRDFIKMNTVDVIKEESVQAVYDRFLSFLQDMDNQETDAIFKAIAILDDAIEAELAKGPYELAEQVRRSIKEKKKEE